MRDFKCPPEMEELVQQIGDFIEYWGFKNVQGRIWAHLFLSAKPLDAADLMARLKISKALVSISLKEMLDYEVLQEVGKSNRGTTLYRANPDQESVILGVLRRRERMMLSKISASQNLCKKIPKKDLEAMELSGESLEYIGGLIEKVETVLDAFLQAPELGPSLLGGLAGHSEKSIDQ